MSEKKSSLDRYKDKEKRIKYNNDFKKTNYRQYSIALHKEKDKDIIEAIDAAKNKADFIRELFRKQQ